MSRKVIEINNLGKQYRLGQVGATTVADDFKRWVYRIRGKEDPFLKVGEQNNRAVKGQSDYVWALKDVSFSVNEGEVLGIIGRNGAGKSTLLKILSRTTTPTVGEYKIKGRVASLLEVGTGFHPDLTGRENIFLNGAILGMTKAEIRRNFDEIVDFSGVERYIDTPVKRYSSGMYVRLAFAVAAHLEPEILIVDEVLAVGDAEFQKKCMGKMKDVSRQGRTVLFVSHNMPSIRALCSSILLMEHGRMSCIGEPHDVIARYLSTGVHVEIDEAGTISDEMRLYNSGEARFVKASVGNMAGEYTKEIFFKEHFKVSFELEVSKPLENAVISVFILNSFAEIILMAVDNEMYKPSDYKAGNHAYEIAFQEHLMPGDYSIGMAISYFHTGNTIDHVENFYPFKVRKETHAKDMEYPWNTIHGYTRPKTVWLKK